MLLICITVVPLPVHAQDPTLQKLAASIGMLRAPVRYPTDFLVMALQNLSQASPFWLPTVLAALEDDDYAATNWLKMAGDDIVDCYRQSPDDFPMETLLALSENWELPPSTRTIAAEWLDRCTRPTAKMAEQEILKLYW